MFEMAMFIGGICGVMGALVAIGLNSELKNDRKSEKAPIIFGLVLCALWMIAGIISFVMNNRLF